MKKIWCIFSVDNNYDQPENNLVAFFTAKPSIEQLMEGLLGNKLRNDEDIVSVVQIWTGSSVRLNGADYRMEEVEEGFNKLK